MGQEIMVWQTISNIWRKKMAEEKQKMIEAVDHPEGKFELAIRILGNEVLGLQMKVDDFKMKWLLIGIFSIAVLMWVMSLFGPAIMSTYGPV